MPQVSEITVLDGLGASRDVATLTAIAALIGEVQASPTSNTLLARLKSIADNTDGLEGSVDGVEASLTAILAKIIAAPATEAKQDSTITAIGALESAIEALSPSLTSRLLSAAASTNSTLVKNAAGRVFSIQGYNAASATRYLKLYNKATAPTVGTDTPVKTIAIPALTAFALDWPNGYEFSTGIGFGLTTAVADNSTAALTSGDVLGLNIDYR